ncbi:MAG: hypothetical protein ACEQSB_07195 [Undibacterium sp.]
MEIKPDTPKTLAQLEEDLAIAENGLLCADYGIDSQIRRSEEKQKYRRWIESIEKQIKVIKNED